MQNRADMYNISKESGHYDGLKELKLKKSDPITYEKIFSKLRAGVVNARETQKKSLHLLSLSKKVSFVSLCTTQLVIVSVLLQVSSFMWVRWECALST
jgi:hypothetical protein